MFLSWIFVVVAVAVMKSEEANGFETFRRPVRSIPLLALHSQKVEGDNKLKTKVDLDHAHECADHFGMCPTQELVEMKEALHRERIQDMVKGTTGVNNPLGPAEELERHLLEDDLANQLDMLREEELKNNNDALIPEDSKALLPKMSHLVEEIEHEFLLEPELPEMAALTVAVLCVLYAPHMIGMN